MATFIGSLDGSHSNGDAWTVPVSLCDAVYIGLPANTEMLGLFLCQFQTPAFELPPRPRTAKT